jgi:hypothetical protein
MKKKFGVHIPPNQVSKFLPYFVHEKKIRYFNVQKKRGAIKIPHIHMFFEKEKRKKTLFRTNTELSIDNYVTVYKIKNPFLRSLKSRGARKTFVMEKKRV